jgi:hypothetical protein
MQYACSRALLSAAKRANLAAIEDQDLKIDNCSSPKTICALAQRCGPAKTRISQLASVNSRQAPGRRGLQEINVSDVLYQGPYGDPHSIDPLTRRASRPAGGFLTVLTAQ